MIPVFMHLESTKQSHAAICTASCTCASGSPCSHAAQLYMAAAPPQGRSPASFGGCAYLSLKRGPPRHPPGRNVRPAAAVHLLCGVTTSLQYAVGDGRFVDGHAPVYTSCII